MKVVFCAYRKWAADILVNLMNANKKGWEISAVVTVPEKEIDFKALHSNVHELNPNDFKDGKASQLFKSLKPDMILFCGWSWIVKKDILDICPCTVIHPSPLPKYRGGSPLQNQVIAGEKTSAISLFQMTEGLDDGPIYKQKGISLEGGLHDIFERMVKVGSELSIEMLNEAAQGKLKSTPQDESKATTCKRRKPEDSEITLDELKNKTAEYLYNKIRMLQDPYPVAYIKTADGKKLYLTKAKIGQ